ncbi:hypothetical protein [Pontibacter oryzae]|nr:hypothetical protein [Pontibacter oryzae]
MSLLLVYLFNALILSGLVYWMFRQNWVRSIRPYVLPALGLKLLLVVFLTILYFRGEFIGDRTTFHKAGITLWEYAQAEPLAYLRLLWFNELESEQLRQDLPFTAYHTYSNSFYFIKLISALNFISAGDYFLNNLYLALFSFWGSAYLVAMLARQFAGCKPVAAIAFVFFPTVLFWSVGLLKDPVMYGSMCWLVAMAIALAHKQTVGPWQLFLLPLQVYLFLKIKMFYAAVLLPLLLVYVLIKRLQVNIKWLRQIERQISLLIILVVVVMLLIVLRIKYFDIDFLLYNVIYSYEGILPRSLDDPHISFTNLQPTLQSLIVNYPKATLSSIYRPFIGESWKPLYVASALENLLLLFLTILSIASAFRKKASIKIELLYVVFLVFILVMAGVTGLSTPNFGTLSRYRIVYLPFLVFLLLQNVYAQRLLRCLRLP